MNQAFKKYLILIPAAISFVVYLLTLAPTVYFIDSGELAAVASTLGIAHPTGYPLFTIIGHLFTLIPLGESEVYKLNLMSAVFCTAALVMFGYLLIYISKNHLSNKTENKLKQNKAQSSQVSLSSTISITIASASVMILAFSRTFWSLANSVEVYSIHVFFIAALLYTFIKAITGRKNYGDPAYTVYLYYILFAFLTGLSFTNHMTTLLLAPACLTMFFLVNYKEKNLYKLLGFMAIAFLIGLSLYLYLPVRANMNPQFNWGNPYNFQRFIWHITGKQFSVWLFSSKGSLPLFIVQILILIAFSAYGFIKKEKLTKFYHISVFVGFFLLSYLILSNGGEIIQKQFNRFLTSIVTEFGPAVFILAIPGLIRLANVNQKLFYFTTILFFGCVLYAVNYDIHDIDSYFVLAYITMVVWIFFGIITIYQFITESIKNLKYRIIIASASLLIAIVPLISNYEINDESNNYVVEQYTMNVFKNIEPNGIIISSQWDFWLSASFFYNFVKGIRKDIVVIDKELLRRSWYFKYLQNHYPEVYERSRTEIEIFLVELHKFEQDLPYDQRIIGKAYTDLLTSFVDKNQDRKIYTTWELEQNQQEPFATQYSRVPDGILFRLIKSDPGSAMSEPIKTYDFNFTPSAENSYYHQTIMNSYNMMLTNSAYLLAQQNRIEEAKKYTDLALTAIPNAPKTLELKKKFNL